MQDETFFIAVLAIAGMAIIFLILNPDFLRGLFADKCPADPHDACTQGFTSVCNEDTHYKWKCVPDMPGGCGNDPPQCVSPQSPSGFTPAWCGPDNEWSCEGAYAKCSPMPADLKCDNSKNSYAMCNESTQNKWKCQDVCGKKPDNCRGAYCGPKLVGEGFQWYCPESLTPADIVNQLGLFVSTNNEVIDAKTGKNKQIFWKQQGSTPVFPTIHCESNRENQTYRLPNAYSNILNAPPGHIVGLASPTKQNQFLFYEYDKTEHLYWQPNQQVANQCILCFDQSCQKPGDLKNQNPSAGRPSSTCGADQKQACPLPCSNNGTFEQDVSTETETGKCKCSSDTWKGDKCQFSDATTCNGHGTVDNDGGCTCQSGWLGAQCQYSNSTTCNNHGTVDSSGNCKCDGNYRSLAGDAKNAQCSKVDSDPAYCYGYMQDCYGCPSSQPVGGCNQVTVADTLSGGKCSDLTCYSNQADCQAACDA